MYHFASSLLTNVILYNDFTAQQSLKRSRRRLLLQILLQNPFVNGQNGRLQSCGLADVRVRLLIFMTLACTRQK